MVSFSTNSKYIGKICPYILSNVANKNTIVILFYFIDSGSQSIYFIERHALDSFNFAFEAVIFVKAVYMIWKYLKFTYVVYHLLLDKLTMHFSKQ